MRKKSQCHAERLRNSILLVTDPPAAPALKLPRLRANVYLSCPQAVWAVLFSSFMVAGIIFVLLETDHVGSMFQSESKCAAATTDTRGSAPMPCPA